jgi:hypothetical protein
LPLNGVLAHKIIIMAHQASLRSAADGQRAKSLAAAVKVQVMLELHKLFENSVDGTWPASCMLDAPPYCEMQASVVQGESH